MPVLLSRPTSDGEYYVSCAVFTVWAKVAGNKIVDAAPIVHKFIGQPFSNLANWHVARAGLRVVKLDA